MNYERINNGLNTKRHTPREALVRKNYIKKLQFELINEKITIEEFLKSNPRCFKELLETIKIRISRDETLLDDEIETPDFSQFDKIERKNNREKNKLYLEEIKKSVTVMQSLVLPTSCNPILSLRKKNKEQNNLALLKKAGQANPNEVVTNKNNKQSLKQSDKKISEGQKKNSEPQKNNFKIISEIINKVI